MENVKLDHEFVTIDGEKYLIQAMRPSRVFVLGLELTKIIGEPFAAAAAAGQDENDEKAANAVSMAAKALMHNVDPERFLQIAQELMGSVELQGSNKKMLGGKEFDHHFHGKTGALLKLLGVCMQFQFKDFFAALLEAVGGVMDQAGKKRMALA